MPLPKTPHLTLDQLNERIYETAVAFKEADDDPSTGKWALSARWGDYTRALTEHSKYMIAEYLQAQAEGTE